MQKRCDPLHEPNLSAPGSHTIYAKIPPNLHEHPCECPRWTMPISRLLTEVIGLDSSEADGLPQKICVVCISYLKHAYTFRRQAIDNVAALLAARYLVTRRAVPFQKNLDKQQLMQTVVADDYGGTYAEDSEPGWRTKRCCFPKD
ncbi:conserved hypothetical protein [Culex quinquefasciatus]|uniref:ZAD domain-containing protein n=1 Tax=Culex quinquefasciatus TaxID=7176 RepID=B0X606_CULQU|nr:conserved hypothetical protein [Culex quinquefasciatus]|eukprot:XP_001865078.1 conserved hypothetical protein [Culex quinquefasciatus]